MKKIFFFLLCVLFVLAALPGNCAPPEYIINTIDKNIVTFDNDASFKINIIGQSALLASWEVNDHVVLFDLEGEFLPRFPKFKNQRFALPGVLLKNVTKNNELRGQLIVSPNTGENGVFIINQIDLNQRIIELDDASQWRISGENLSTVARWNVGDIVMIGRASRPITSFNMILFNTDKPSYARVEEQ